MGLDQSKSGLECWSLGKGPPQHMTECGGYGPGVVSHGTYIQEELMS